MRKLGQKGDTIVEVLICLAIVGVLISTAYLIANRSQIGIRSSQERAEATKLAEMQVERIRHGSSMGRTYSGSDFCINIALNSVGDNNAVCSDGLYKMSVDYDVTDEVFTVAVTWDTLGGGQSTVNMYYRVF